MTDLTVTCRSQWPGRPERVVPVAPGTDLFTALREGGVPIASSCTGQKVCGRCLVTVLAGQVGAPEADEQRVLDRAGAAPDERLACRLAPTPGLVVTAGYW